MWLLKNLRAYAPKDLGKIDLLIGSGRILSIGQTIDPFFLPDERVETVASASWDAAGEVIVVPGFFDGHVHLIGGGGEGGFGTRTPEGTSEMFFDTGTTSVLGVLGTDGVTRDLKSLYGKAMQLRTQGLNAFMLTGNYRYPPKTITGDVVQDIVLIREVLGFGELAVADHRGSGLTAQELKRLGLDCRVAGLTSGKAGKLVLHMGDGSEGLSPLFEATDDRTLPASQLLPTHISRNERVLAEGMRWIEERGGSIDFTAGKETASLLKPLSEQKHWSNVTVSSDGLGSFPVFNEERECIRVDVAPVTGLLEVFKQLVSGKSVQISHALLPFTLNPARFFGLETDGVGTIRKGGRADLLFFDERLNLLATMSEGVFRYRKP
ncbi:MAG TPA: beta-aspartyl-peptidase [Thermotogota bacterium]|nr:beta-aspartyl-peptidase [Thermotogota bacterium]HPB87924.1 beta-aspartyl-peptidase [Thermotogota bacterium]HPH11098.1 beta-aspartyl-peptidase [Thermotogota bacterium]HQN22663.1 beta-aspartyl-peptidase [Thermotogota bacterium]HQQ66612.1 beta-aspartyl-peptidase [Thermotogota bacterium]